MQKKIIKLSIILLIIFIVGVFFIGLNKNSIYDTKNLVGTNLDNFELNSLNKKLKINQDLVKKSQYTLINFWASWCAPCRAEHKYLINLKRNAKNLKLIGINFKDEKKNANKFLSEFGDPYHYSAADSEGKVSINFGVYGIPESILVNNDLKIIKKFIGPLNQDEYTSILNLTN